MKNDIRLETAIDFIRRNQEHAELAQLVARAVPALQDRIKRHIREKVTENLRKSRDRSNWCLDEAWGGRPKVFWRLRLHKKDGHWSERRFSGVWFQWDGDRKAYRVGIEWPQDRGTNLDESFRECFREAGVELSPRREGGGDGGRPRTWWFFGYPAGDDWVGWDRLLVKTNEEIPQFVSTTVDFMKRLAEVIDRSDRP